MFPRLGGARFVYLTPIDVNLGLHLEEIDAMYVSQQKDVDLLIKRTNAHPRQSFYHCFTHFAPSLGL